MSDGECSACVGAYRGLGDMSESPELPPGLASEMRRTLVYELDKLHQKQGLQAKGEERAFFPAVAHAFGWFVAKAAELGLASILGDLIKNAIMRIINRRAPAQAPGNEDIRQVVNNVYMDVLQDNRVQTIIQNDFNIPPGRADVDEEAGVFENAIERAVINPRNYTMIINIANRVNANNRGLSWLGGMGLGADRDFFETSNIHPGPGTEVISGTTRALRPTKSLVIGIDYVFIKPGSPGRLQGCANDARLMRDFLLSQGFPVDQMRVLSDEVLAPVDPLYGSSPEIIKPTRKNMEAAFRWLASGNQPGDSIFLHYSGHGAFRPLGSDSGTDRGLQNFDIRQTDTIVPCDFLAAGMIGADWLFDNLIAPLPEGVRMTAMMDCCHSGTNLHLGYKMTASKRNCVEAAKSGYGLEPDRNYAQWTSMTPCKAIVIAFKGCRDDQTSLGLYNVKKVFGAGEDSPGGAATAALLSILYKHRGSMSYVGLLDRMRCYLKSMGIKQVPQMSASQQLDLRDSFTLHR